MKFRRWHLAILRFIIITVCIELLSFGVFKYYLMEKKVAYNQVISRAYSKIHWRETNKLEYHPYLVYAKNRQEISTNSDLFNIAILGGSFAEGTDDAFQKIKYKCMGKNIKFTNLSEGGYRQPQQLISSILYMDKFNGFISIEGFNEATGDGPHCRPPDWNQQSQAYDPKYRNTRYFRLYNYLKASHQGLYKLTKYLYSPKVILYYASESIKIVLDQLMHKHESVAKSSCPEDPRRDIRRVWLKYLKVQHALFANSNKKILTFIQPNQYLEGTKKWSADEKKIFSSKEKGSQQGIDKKYSDIISKVEKLNNKNIINLTKIYLNVEDTVYNDECCHVNSLGNQIVVREIMKYIKKRFCNE